MHRTDLMDTSEWAHRFMIERYRAMMPEERLRIMFGLIDAGRQMHALALQRLKETEDQDRFEPSC
jgi:hypothetical protein